MSTLLNRRQLVTSASLAAGGLGLGSLTAAGVAAQATPASMATPVPGCGPRNPYDFLGNLPSLAVTSTDVQQGQEMPAPQRSGIAKAGGQDHSPQLSWSGQPEGVKSYIVSMYDPDAPTPSGFWHWAVVNIPADTTALPSGAGTPGSTTLPTGSVQLPNDVSLAQYVGAAPPPGPSHRYFIAVLALDVATLDIAKTATPALMYATASGHIKAFGLLVPIATTKA